MSGDTETQDHYHLNGTLPTDIPDHLNEFLPQDDEEEDLTLEEVILQQLCVYQSYQEQGTNRVVGIEDDDQETDSESSEEEAESSSDESVISQLALDEAHARSLQEFGEEFDAFFITEFNGSSERNQEERNEEERNQEERNEEERNQEDIDTDNLRYEDLLDLTETVGVENVGLSATRISQLPTSIYTSGMLSTENEEICAICQERFKFGKRVMTLDCCHLYHSKCIIRWLKLKKNCPVCQKEVV